MEYPLKKSFSLNLYINSRILGIFPRMKSYKVEYNEATMRDYMQYMEYKDKEKYFLDFIKEYSNISKADLVKIYADKIQFTTIISNINKTFFWALDNQEKSTDFIKKSPDSSMYVFLRSNGITKEEFFDMTISELNYFIQWVVWNMNEQTKEGRARNMNEMAKIRRESRSESEKDRIQKILDNIEWKEKEEKNIESNNK